MLESALELHRPLRGTWLLLSKAAQAHASCIFGLIIVLAFVIMFSVRAVAGQPLLCWSSRHCLHVLSSWNQLNTVAVEDMLARRAVLSDLSSWSTPAESHCFELMFLELHDW